jgi:hypothetical protein
MSFNNLSWLAAFLFFAHSYAKGKGWRGSDVKSRGVVAASR